MAPLPWPFRLRMAMPARSSSPAGPRQALKRKRQPLRPGAASALQVVGVLFALLFFAVLMDEVAQCVDYAWDTQRRWWRWGEIYGSGGGSSRGDDGNDEMLAGDGGGDDGRDGGSLAETSPPEQPGPTFSTPHRKTRRQGKCCNGK